tara:strand:- start:304 stop:480 length:177 start_codon:yes stop_codon:yes gene_type:complete
MTNNSNEPKQLDCELRCSATANLKLDVAQDMYQEDKRLAELLGGDTEDETKDDKEPNN